SVVGTPHYMAPEQMRGEDIDHRADMYSLGLTLFTCLSGHKPYTAKTPFDLMMMHAKEPLPIPHEWKAIAGGRLVKVLEKLTAKEPDGRYATWEDATTALIDLEAALRADKPQRQVKWKLAGAA